ncbi:MAG: amidohydrolase family protein, partial [Xanthomonadales bacterium]|nr:amidohydrolase family protein [Xanthomonadales bacterium]
MPPDSASHRTWYAEQALLPSGWARDVCLTIDAAGDLVEVAAGASRADATPLGRWVVPGMPNLHSHAFQRAMAGLAERQAAERDTFWSWRETMYRYAGAVDPAALHAIAAQLYADLLLHGYTAVCEFHYLHHQPDGRPYAPPRAMCDALVAAALETGIGLSLLPTLYMTGGFDGRALGERQRRFHHEVDALLALAGSVRAGAG